MPGEIPGESQVASYPCPLSVWNPEWLNEARLIFDLQWDYGIIAKAVTASQWEVSYDLYLERIYALIGNFQIWTGRSAEKGVQICRHINTTNHR